MKKLNVIRPPRLKQSRTRNTYMYAEREKGIFFMYFRLSSIAFNLSKTI